MHDIYRKTGIKPKDIEIESVSFVDNIAIITVYYDPKDKKKSYLIDISSDDPTPNKKQPLIIEHSFKKMRFNY